jgi:osmotically-inducible protein OsmY
MADRYDRDYQRDYYGSGPRPSGERGGQGSGRYQDEPRRPPRREPSHQDRGFFERAGDEVRSWFGDEEAERRRMEERRESGWNEPRAYARGERDYGRRDWDRSRESSSYGGTQGASGYRSDWGNDYGHSYGNDAQAERSWEGGRSGSLSTDRWGIGGRGRSEMRGGAERYGSERYGREGYGAEGYGRGRESGSFYPVAAWSYTETWSVPGPYSGRGPKGYKRSDERIREDIADRLSQHGRIDASEIQVTVSDCEVTLHGTVDSREEKRLAEDLAEGVSGVREVNNQLRVSRRDEFDRDRGRGYQASSLGQTGASGLGTQGGTHGAQGSQSGQSGASSAKQPTKGGGNI